MSPSRSAWLAGAALTLLVLLVTQDSPPQTLSVQVAPPHGSTESGSTASAYQPTPLEKLRAAAKSYFPDMFNDPKFALPDQFEQTWANPCWIVLDPGRGSLASAKVAHTACRPEQQQDRRGLQVQAAGGGSGAVGLQSEVLIRREDPRPKSSPLELIQVLTRVFG